MKIMTMADVKAEADAWRQFRKAEEAMIQTFQQRFAGEVSMDCVDEAMRQFFAAKKLRDEVRRKFDSEAKHL